MSAKKYYVGFVILIALIAFAAWWVLAPRGAQNNSTASATEISLMVFGNPEELAAFRSVASAFNGEQAEVHVNLVEASDRADLLARLSTSFAAGNPPDLFLLNYRYIAKFGTKALLENLNDRLATSQAFQVADFYPEAMKAFQFSGAQSCLPQNISSLVVYYNRSMFKAAGVQEPVNGWSWDDRVAAAKKRTKRYQAC